MSKMEMPKYLREKLRVASNEHANKVYGVNYTEAARELMAEDYEAGGQQIYADILAELGPVVDGLTKIKNYFCACSCDDEIVPQIVAGEALKHIKERIL